VRKEAEDPVGLQSEIDEPVLPGKMVLELHVWGPAYGLPSLEPECLAVIAYFTQGLDKSEWTLVRSSPSTVPTRRFNPVSPRDTSSQPHWPRVSRSRNRRT
jgi:hypothetical protein